VAYCIGGRRAGEGAGLDTPASEPVARYWVENREEGITSIECNHRRVVGLSEQDLIDIIGLASTWLEYVQQKQKDEKARLLPIVQNIPLEQLFKSAPRPTPAPDTSQPKARRRPL
jgi:hypothetical protein